MRVVLENRLPRKDSPEISVVIPIYRGGKTIQSLIRSVRETFMSIAGSSYEIIIVNDGSDDNTQSVLEQEKDNKIRVISYLTNKGKGYAVKKGILESRGQNVVYMDGDMDILPISMQEFIDGLKTHDLVIGSKSHSASTVNTLVTRKLCSRAFNTLVRKFTGMKIRDTQTGLKAGRGDVLRAIFEAMTVNGYAFDVELLCIAHLLNLNVMEAPVKIINNRSFRISSCLRMMIELLVISYRLKNRSYNNKLTQIM